jgi:hypothetical protein
MERSHPGAWIVEYPGEGGLQMTIRPSREVEIGRNGPARKSGLGLQENCEEWFDDARVS